MTVLATRRPHLLPIATSMSVRPISSFVPLTCASGGAQLMIGLNAVLGTMDVSLKLWIAQIAQCIDAADQLVELEDGFTGAMVPG